MTTLKGSCNCHYTGAKCAACATNMPHPRIVIRKIHAIRARSEFGLTISPQYVVSKF